jgi:hypothetical protein
MKKLLLFPAAFLLLLTSCGGDDDPAYVPPAAQTFMFDDNNYSLLAFQSITEVKMENALTAGGNSYDRSSINVIGMIGFTETATVGFDLYYRHGLSIAGTYTIYDDVDGEDTFDDFIAPIERSCLGWLTTGVVFHNNSGTDFFRANNPSGTVTITANSANNYTIQYSGNFKNYDDDINFVRNVPVSVNVTGDVTTD